MAEENKEVKKSGMIKVLMVLVVIFALFIGLGPIIVSKIADKLIKLRPTSATKVYAKVAGVISVQDNNVVLTSINNYRYVLEGDSLYKIRDLKGINLQVFGRMKSANPEEIEINGKKAAVKFNIDVTSYDTKELQVGKDKVSQEDFDKVKKRVEDKQNFQQYVLKKVGANAPYSVIKGKLTLESFSNPKTSKINQVLVLKDDYGDSYVVIGKGIFPVLEDYTVYKGVTVVLLGDVTLPVPDIPIIEGVVTFNAKVGYLEDLTTRITDKKAK